MKTYSFLFSFFFISIYISAQIIPANRTVQWSYASLSTVPAINMPVVDITNYGGNGNGTLLNDAAFVSSLNALNGMAGVIYFPAGTYLFNSSLTIPDSTVLRGESSTLSKLKFDLSGAINDCIKFNGSIQPSTYYFANDGLPGTKQIQLINATGLQVGDYVKILQNDSALVVSSWALGTVGQIGKVKTINGNTIELDHELRKEYTVSDSSYLQIMNPVKNSGIECLYIERLDATASQTSNISFTNAVDCYIRGVESNMTNFAHVTIRSSSNIYVTGSYFHHAFAYGGNGQGYGINCETTSGECLIENNIFNTLRHSMLCQAGVNGNVFAYNYSVNPFWNQAPFPANAAGDIVLHGNYAFANLFEGNIVQNIVIDNSHGINGPYNSFFRNRAELYGVIMGTNPSSNDQNFVGNEITNTGFSFGNYLLTGAGHFEYGNNVNGTIIPSGTTSLSDSSYYLAQQPPFLAGNTWPCIGFPAPFNQLSIPAKQRFGIQNTVCPHNTSVLDDVKLNKNDFEIQITDAGNTLEIINKNKQRSFFLIADLQGRILAKRKITGQIRLSISSLANSMYMVSNGSSSIKFVKNSF